jgi:O-antigen ligase
MGPTFQPARMVHARIGSPAREIFRDLEFICACGAVFFAPMNFLRFDSFYFTLSDAFTCLCLGAMAINGSVKPKVFGPGTGYWISGLVLMMAGLLVSSLFAGAVDRGLILSGQYVFAYFLLPVILLARPWRETIILMKVFVLSMVVMSLHGIYVIDYVGEKFTTFVSGNGRLQGFVERENECGSLLALTVPMVLVLTERRALHPLLGLGIIILLAYAIMLTGSNTALYGMLFGLGVFFLASITGKRIFQAGICLAGLWAAVNIPVIREMLPAVFQKRVLVGLETGNINEAGTFADRVLLIKEAIRFAEHATFLGYGADQYREMSSWHTPVHNLYLLIWVEGGLPTLAGFLVMLAGAGILLGAAWRHAESRTSAVCGVATLTLFALLINAAPHVYGRFWTVPVLLAMAPAVTYLAYGPPRSRVVKRIPL